VISKPVSDPNQCTAFTLVKSLQSRLSFHFDLWTD